MGKFTFILLLLAATVSGCTPSKMSINKATAQKWYGGAAGSGGGKIYRVYVAKATKASLEITQVWVGDKNGGIAPRFRTYQDSSTTELKGGKVDSGLSLFRVEFSETFPAPPNPRQNEDDNPQPTPTKVKAPVTLPADFKQGAVITYNSQGKTGHWIVSDFKNLPPLAYP